MDKETINQDIWVISEKDFYPPQDNRTFKSGISDIYGGVGFREYAEEMFELLTEEVFIF